MTDSTPATAARWWFDSRGYWLWRRFFHRWACGGRWIADGGCLDCDLMRRYVRTEGTDDGW